ncbi:MAG: nitroreductase family deazaflavin-dependent oxidoreductase [Candidatus Dormibacteraeota bacterium]|nr:nitroreductase family deazaflavin-dependent oxidoreductase [Candidatus Dormibacteraeota bacterium]
MSSQVTNAVRLPGLVPLFNPIARRLMRLGVPMGPNALLGVRGRKSGQTRTTPVALLQVGGRRWVIGTFGDVNWVRNLRAAGEGTITLGRRRELVRAEELTHDERVTFFTEILRPYVRGGVIRRRMISILKADDIIDDPAGAAEGRPVFELHRIQSNLESSTTE